MSERIRRLQACVEVWPECHEGGYHPSCCRFPKSCSCDIYDPELVSEADLEPEDYPDADGLAALRTEAERKFRDMQERGESYWHRAEAAETEVERLTRECLDREATETDARERLRRCEAKLASLGEAVKDVCWKVTPYGKTEDSDIAAYIAPKGTIHRLIGAAQSAGIPAAFRAALADTEVGEPS